MREFASISNSRALMSYERIDDLIDEDVSESIKREIRLERQQKQHKFLNGLVEKEERKINGLKITKKVLKELGFNKPVIYMIMEYMPFVCGGDGCKREIFKCPKCDTDQDFCISHYGCDNYIHYDWNVYKQKNIPCCEECGTRQELGL